MKASGVKKQQPFLPLFFGDFLASTSEWSGEEQALYVLLLGHSWALGSLPPDPAKVCRVARWNRKLFDKCWDQVKTKFEERDGRLYNDRLEQHRAKSLALAEKNSEAGKRGAEKRWRENGERHSERYNGGHSERHGTAIATRHDETDGAPYSNPSHPIPEEERDTHNARARETDLHASFEKLKASYPKFAGRQNWIAAELHYRNRIDLGVTVEALHQAVERYAAFVAAGGVTGTAYVLRPETFLSAADKPWDQPWTLPEEKPRAKPAPPKFVAPPDEPEAVNA